MTIVSSINIFARDLDGLIDFYIRLFGFSEHMDQRGPIYRALDGGGVAVGFNALEAYRLLNLDGFPPPAGVKSLLTFEVADHDAVERLTDKAETLGATIVKAPYGTFYGSRQSVVLDPEGNVFRINAFKTSVAS